MTNKNGGEKRLAIFVSGTGSNAKSRRHYFAEHKGVSVALVVATKVGIGAINFANEAGVPCCVCSPKTDFNEGGVLAQNLTEYGITHIVLAGCLAFLPAWLTAEYGDKIINIHPSLLPKYGGKGMYGDHVHKAVIEAKEQESGITIHLVNNEYDSGAIVFQAKCEVRADDTIETLAARVHALEHEHFPKVIEKWCNA